MYSYGLLAWSADREYFYISTDTSYSNPYKAGVNYNTLELEDNLLFQDCDVMNLSTGVHPNYDELKKLNPKTKKKMWLYHYTDLSKYDEFGDMPDAVADGFAGFVKEGQIFEL